MPIQTGWSGQYYSKAVLVNRFMCHPLSSTLPVPGQRTRTSGGKGKLILDIQLLEEGLTHYAKARRFSSVVPTHPETSGSKRLYDWVGLCTLLEKGFPGFLGSTTQSITFQLLGLTHFGKGRRSRCVCVCVCLPFLLGQTRGGGKGEGRPWQVQPCRPLAQHLVHSGNPKGTARLQHADLSSSTGPQVLCPPPALTTAWPCP